MMETARKLTNNKIEFLDPYTFFALLKIHLENLSRNSKTITKKYVEWNVGKNGYLAPISFNDGIFEIKTLKDEKIIYQSVDDIKYIYFQINDAFAKKFAKGKHDAEIKITLFDNKKGKIGINYDGLQDGESKAYIDLENYKYLTGNKKWKTVTFKLKTPLFLHRENANADFRLINFATDLIVKDVKVKFK